eukprot:UN12548
MEGISDSEYHRGIIPRSVEKIFNQIELLKEENWEYDVSVSFLEIYNEEIYDLLGNKDDALKIRYATDRRKSNHRRKSQLKINNLG